MAMSRRTGRSCCRWIVVSSSVSLSCSHSFAVNVFIATKSVYGRNNLDTLIRFLRSSVLASLGRLFWVDLIKLVSNVRPSVRPSVRACVWPSVCKMFLRFRLNLAYRSMSDARRSAVCPDPRSRSRSWALESWKSFHFQTLSPPPFTMTAGNWPTDHLSTP